MSAFLFFLPLDRKPPPHVLLNTSMCKEIIQILLRSKVDIRMRESDAAPVRKKKAYAKFHGKFAL